jgi:hypothetical protein
MSVVREALGVLNEILNYRLRSDVLSFSVCTRFKAEIETTFRDVLNEMDLVPVTETMTASVRRFIKTMKAWLVHLKNYNVTMLEFAVRMDRLMFTGYSLPYLEKRLEKARKDPEYIRFNNVAVAKKRAAQAVRDAAKAKLREEASNLYWKLYRFDPNNSLVPLFHQSRTMHPGTLRAVHGGKAGYTPCFVRAPNGIGGVTIQMANVGYYYSCCEGGAESEGCTLKPVKG